MHGRKFPGLASLLLRRVSCWSQYQHEVIIGLHKQCVCMSGEGEVWEEERREWITGKGRSEKKRKH